MSSESQTAQFSPANESVTVNPSTSTMENQVNPSPTVESTAVKVEKEEDDPGNPPTHLDAFREWFDKKHNLLNVTWKHALVYLILSYVVNAIYFWALDDAGRQEFARVIFYIFGRIYNVVPVQFFLGALVFLSIGRWFQAYQTMLPGTNRLMRYYSTSLKPFKKDDTLWPEQRLRMVRKWNDWVLLAWLLTIRVISGPLRNKYPNLESILIGGFMTKVEMDVINAEIATKDLKRSELSLVVFEWLLNLNEMSANDYRAPNDFKNNFDAIQNLKRSGSHLIKFSAKNIPKVMILVATLVVYIFGISSILGHNVVEYEKEPFSCISTSAIVGAFFYPIVYAIPFFLYLIWLRFLRSTTDPFGWDEEDVDTCKIFKAHVENANRFCHIPGANYAVVMDQINAQP